jgi:hypothetical protein
VGGSATDLLLETMFWLHQQPYAYKQPCMLWLYYSCFMLSWACNKLFLAGCRMVDPLSTHSAHLSSSARPSGPRAYDCYPEQAPPLMVDCQNRWKN